MNTGTRQPIIYLKYSIIRTPQLSRKMQPTCIVHPLAVTPWEVKLCPATVTNWSPPFLLSFSRKQVY